MDGPLDGPSLSTALLTTPSGGRVIGDPGPDTPLQAAEGYRDLDGRIPHTNLRNFRRTPTKERRVRVENAAPGRIRTKTWPKLHDPRSVAGVRRKLAQIVSQLGVGRVEVMVALGGRPRGAPSHIANIFDTGRGRQESKKGGVVKTRPLLTSPLDDHSFATLLTSLTIAHAPIRPARTIKRS